MNPVAHKLYDKHLFDLMNWVEEFFPLLDVTAVMMRMLVDLRVCRAVTETGFIKWAHAYIRRAADELLDNQVSTLEDVVELARSRDTEPKPAFIAEQHPSRPDVSFVLIERGRRAQHAVWIVPTDHLGLVQILHPTVEVRFTRIANQRYAYLVKRCQQQTHNGSWRTVTRDLLNIWLGTDWPIHAIDGNYLNFLPDNLRVERPTNQDALDRAAFHELRPDKDTFDWKPYASTPVPRNQDQDEESRFYPGAQDVQTHRWLCGKSLLKDDGMFKALTMREKTDAAAARAVAFPVDVAVRKLRRAWGLEY